MAPSRLQAAEAMGGALCVVAGIRLLSFLDDHPMPKLGAFLKVEDLNFYAPPLAAIAIALMDARSLSTLRQSLIALIGSQLVAVLLVRVFGPTRFARALAAGGAFLFMKFYGTMYAPAGALSVLFIDNVQMQSRLGWMYCLMPGVSGTMVLALLAYLKIRMSELLHPAIQRWFGSKILDQLSSPLLSKRE